MISTALVSADDPTAKPIFETASKLGIPYIKPGYYHYKFVNVIDERDQAGRKFLSLVELAAEISIATWISQPHGLHRGCALGHSSSDRAARSALVRFLF